MTFKDLLKVIQSQAGPEQSQALQRLRDKPFWYLMRVDTKKKIEHTKDNVALITLLAYPENTE